MGDKMNSNCIKIFVVMSVLSNLLACTKDQQKTNSKVLNANQQNTGQSTAEGPGHGGGGNGTNVRLYESFAVKITELPAYKNIAEKALMRIFDESQGEKIFLDKHLQIKTWYLVPNHLKPIDKEIIGVSQTESSTQQLAFQTENEIWIDQIYFNQMTEADQATLIVHEMMMLYYGLKSKDLNSLCQMGIMSKDDSVNCNMFKIYDSYFPAQTARPLDKNDYEKIRTVTYFFMANAEDTKLTINDFKQKMIQNGFDRRLFTPVSNVETDGYDKVPTSFLFEQINKLNFLNRPLDKCFSKYFNKEIPCHITTQNETETIRSKYEVQWQDKDGQIQKDIGENVQIFNSMLIELKNAHQIKSLTLNRLIKVDGINQNLAMIPVDWNEERNAFIATYAPVKEAKAGEKTKMNIFLFKEQRQLGSNDKTYELQGLIVKQIAVTDIVHPTPEYYFKTNRCISKEVAATNPQDDTLLIYNEDKNLELLKMYSIFDSMIDICY